MIKLYADKNQLAVREKELITSGSVNVYTVRFEFSDDWDGLEKTAVFQAGRVKKTACLPDETCVIPPEPLAVPGHYLMVGVCGRQGDTLVLPTRWENLGMIMEGAVSLADMPPGQPPEGGSADHRQLSHRDAAEQHPISSITGLTKELNRIPEPAEALTNSELEALLK